MRILSPILLSLFLFLSCTKEIDFDQVNDLVITPAAEFSITYIDAEADDFFVNGLEITQPVSDFIEIDVFDDAATNDNLTRIDLIFETENTLPRDFRFEIRFLDENLGVISTATIAFETTDTSPHTFTFEGADLEALKNTAILVYSVELLPGSPLSPDTPGMVSMKSKGVFYFNFEA